MLIMIKKKRLVTLIRTTIHSCDFSSGSYTYVEKYGIKHLLCEYWSKKEFGLVIKNVILVDTTIRVLEPHEQAMLNVGDYCLSSIMYWVKLLSYERRTQPLGLTVQGRTAKHGNRIYSNREEERGTKNHLGITLKKCWTWRQNRLGS
jgi:hypothetical protein